MQFRYLTDRIRYRELTNSALRDAFIVSDLFRPDEIELTYSEIDRAVLGTAVPASGSLELHDVPALSSDYLLQNRELGVINIGGNGRITCDAQSFECASLDSLYVARETKTLIFESADKDNPAKFYLVSYPAHATHQTRLVSKPSANQIHLGVGINCNERTIYQSIRPGIVETCQIVMGFTQIAPGSVWNTYPPHTHQRRSEIYMYFNMPEADPILHLMGEPDNVRTMFVGNEEAVLSPMWSMHSGVGASDYSFVWAMGGENQDFDDMDHLAPAALA